MVEYSVVGKSVERTDGRVKVTGKAKYAGDLVAPGMLHGKLLRSPLAHAKILNIDTAGQKRSLVSWRSLQGRISQGSPLAPDPIQGISFQCLSPKSTILGKG